MSHPISKRNLSGQWTSFSLENISENQNLSKLIIDINNQKWIQLKNNGLIVFDENRIGSKVKKLSVLESEGSLNSNRVYSIIEDLDGEIWIGSDNGVNVFYNPEFIAQGTIIKDVQNADTVLICGDKFITEHKHVTLLKEIFEKIQSGDCSIHYMSTKAGEIVKIAINTFLTTKISYANTIGQVLALSELDDEIDSVLEAIGNDSRIGKKYLKFGFGFGGPCFPRDNRAFASYANQVGVEFNIGQTTDDFNREHAKFLFSYFTKKNKHNLPFVFPSVAYKKGTDIIEESQQYRLCLDLLDAGHKVHVIDDSLKDICDDRILYSRPTGYFFNIDL